MSSDIIFSFWGGRWDGCMASLMQWTWTWTKFGRRGGTDRKPTHVVIFLFALSWFCFPYLHCIASILRCPFIHMLKNWSIADFQYCVHWVYSTVIHMMLGKTEDRRKRGWQRMKWLDGITDLMDMSLSKLQEIVKGREIWRAAVHGIATSRTRLSDWTTIYIYLVLITSWLGDIKEVT